MPASMDATVALSNLGKRNRNSGPRVDDMRSADEEAVRIFGTEVRAKKNAPRTRGALNQSLEFAATYSCLRPRRRGSDARRRPEPAPRPWHACFLRHVFGVLPRAS